MDLAGTTVPGFGPALSADGRYVAYYSYSANLVANDTNGRADIFIRDSVSGATIRASVDEDGLQLAGGATQFGLSPNGQVVVFLDESAALRRFDQATGRSSIVNTRDDPYVGPAFTRSNLSEFVATDGGPVAMIGDGVVGGLLIMNPDLRTLAGLSAIGVDLEKQWIQPANYGGGGFGQGILIHRFSSTPDLSTIAFQNLGNQYVEGDTNNSVDILVWTASP